MSMISPAVPRSDAARNRAALLIAAKRVFTRYGTGAPLALIVKEAGVGRGTLYRHFEDREALFAALLDERIVGLESLVVEDPRPGRLERVIRQFPDYLLDIPGLLPQFRATERGRSYMPGFRARVEAMIDDLLRDAHHHNEVREDITTRDVILLLTALDGVAAEAAHAGLPADVRRAADLLLRAILTEVV